MYYVKNGKYMYLLFIQCYKVILMVDFKCLLYKVGNVFLMYLFFFICIGRRMIFGMLI